MLYDNFQGIAQNPDVEEVELNIASRWARETHWAQRVVCLMLWEIAYSSKLVDHVVLYFQILLYNFVKKVLAATRGVSPNIYHNSR
jgi:hypothetical protein